MICSIVQSPIGTVPGSRRTLRGSDDAAREQCADKKDSHQRTQAAGPTGEGVLPITCVAVAHDVVDRLAEVTGVGDSFYSRSSVTFTSHWCASVAWPLTELRASPTTVAGPASNGARPSAIAVISH